MKFLGPAFDSKDLMPLNMYYNPGDYMGQDSDCLDIIFKDIATGKKYVQTLINPEIEIWITKPEYRNYKYIKNFMERSKCDCVKMRYKTRFSTIAKILNISPKDAKFSPYIFQADMKIEHFYMIQFISEYGTDALKKCSMGFLDTENDIFQVNGFPEPGEAPMNCVTFIDKERGQSYTLVLKKDNIPKTDESNPKHVHYENLRKSFWEQMTYFENHILEFIKEMHDTYDDVYGKYEYNICIMEDELELFKLLFKIIRASDNDFIYIWNSPYDMSSMIERIKVLGGNPDDVIGDPSFYQGDSKINKNVIFKEDKNALVHKRKHICNTYTMPTFVDQMVIYAGIRSARGKIPSLKLNAIAEKELHNSKLDYSEEGDMKYFPYMNWWKFVKYNINDVLLQVGIDGKTNDSASMYMNIYNNAVLVNEIFTSTKILENSIRLFVMNLRDGYLVGSNKNKLYPDSDVDFKKLLGLSEDNAEEDESDDFQYQYFDISDDDNAEEDDDGKEKKKEKFQGAIVMNPPHMTSTGFELLGKPAQFIHDHVIDFDITSSRNLLVHGSVKVS